MSRLLSSVLRQWATYALVLGCALLLHPRAAEGGRSRQARQGTLWASGTGCNPNHFIRDELVVLEVYGMLTNFHFLETECVVGPYELLENSRVCCLADTDLCTAPIKQALPVRDACTHTHYLGR